MKSLIPTIVVATLMTACAAFLCGGCISITNNIALGKDASADPEQPAIAAMQKLGTTNDVSAQCTGTVAVNCAIYSHKVVSPDTTATLAK